MHVSAEKLWPTLDVRVVFADVDGVFGYMLLVRGDTEGVAPQVTLKAFDCPRDSNSSKFERCPAAF